MFNAFARREQAFAGWRRDALGFDENKVAAKDGADVAGNARKQLETQSGKKVTTRQNCLESKPTPALPPAVENEFPSAGTHRIACKVQDDMGGEGMWSGESVVE